MGGFDGEERFAWAFAHKIGILISVQDEEVHVRRIIGRAMHLANKRLEDPVQMRPDGMGGNFKGKTLPSS